jgi:hypothetical protein
MAAPMQLTFIVFPEPGVFTTFRVSSQRPPVAPRRYSKHLSEGAGTPLSRGAAPVSDHELDRSKRGTPTNLLDK